MKKKKTIDTEKTEIDYTKTDPDGSYTGVPSNPREKPVQDVDDL